MPNSQKFLILGNNPTAWVTACLLKNTLRKTSSEVCIVFSNKTDTGYDPAIVMSPQSQVIHETLGLNEAELLSFCQGEFSLATHYQDWAQKGSSCTQGLGAYGAEHQGHEFHSFYIKYKNRFKLPAYEAFSLAACACNRGAFSHPSADKRSILSSLNYNLHLDSALYCEYLQVFAASIGVISMDDHYLSSTLGSQGIKSITLEKAGDIEADFFIDCTGAESRLLGQALNIGFEFDSCLGLGKHRLDYEVAGIGAQSPAVQYYAHGDYWSKATPLHTKTVHTVIFDNDLNAGKDLALDLKGKTAGSQVTGLGYRKSFWYKNCVAIGEAAATFQPLPGAGMDIDVKNLQSFIGLLPSGPPSSVLAQEYNQVAMRSYQQLRNYHHAHYLVSQRSNSTFWQHKRNLNISDSLTQKLELFKINGRISMEDFETMPYDSWVSLLLGFGVLPVSQNVSIDQVDEVLIRKRLMGIYAAVQSTAQKMPPHAEYRQRYLAQARY